MKGNDYMSDINLVPYVGKYPGSRIDAAIGKIPSIENDLLNKQDQLSKSQLDAVNSGITASKVEELSAKQDPLSEQQMTSVNSGISSEDVNTISTTKSTLANVIDSGSKNLLEMTQTLETITRYGITATYNKEDGTITLNGEHKSSDPVSIFELYSGNAADTRIIPAGNYHLSGCISGGSTNTWRCVLSPMNVVDTGNGKDFTLSEPSYAAWRILISGNCTFDNQVFKPMVCTQDSWKTSQQFEPFRPSYAETSRNALDAKSTAEQAIQNSELSVHGTKLNILASNLHEICEGDANNLPNNCIFGIKVNYGAISNLPSYVYTLSGTDAQNAGSIITFGKESGRGYGDTQIFVGYGSQTHIRIYTGAWQVWRRLTTANYRNILGIGDSICEGWRNNNMGFAGMLGVPFTNKGITGATLGFKDGKSQIYTEMDNLSGIYDAVIADGGINDYSFNVPLGDMPTQPVITSEDATALDKTTVSGGLQYLLYRMITELPKAQRYFLITHKTKNYPYTANSAGYTQQQLHDRIVDICKMYNTKVIDIYEESIINSAYSVYVSPTAFSTDHSITDKYYVDKDQIHPLWLGYYEGYLPIIQQVMQTATIKTS